MTSVLYLFSELVKNASACGTNVKNSTLDKILYISRSRAGMIVVEAEDRVIQTPKSKMDISLIFNRLKIAKGFVKPLLISQRLI